MEREAFSFGHLAMVEKTMTIATVMVTQIPFGHCRYRVRQNEVLCHGIPKSVAQRWQLRTAVEAKRNVKLLQLICIIRVQHHIPALQHRLRWPLALLHLYWRQTQI